MLLRNYKSEYPEFLLKSTQWCAIMSFIILSPFSINDFIQGRYLLGALTGIVTILCIINALLCYRGNYNKEINLYLIAPIITLTIMKALNELGIMGSYWAYMGVLAFYFMLPDKLARIINFLFIGTILPIAWNVLEPQVALRFSAVLIGVSFFALLSMREIYKQHYVLKGQAVTDSLTGLYNRSILQGSLEHAIHQNHRSGTAMTLIMFDIDHFKQINDEFGHDMGDQVLKSLGDFLNNFFRASDMVFRVGGEEFLVLIYNTDRQQGGDVAEKLRRELEQLPLISERPVTVSIGVSSLTPEINWKEWIKRCDKNLYLAKSAGRNQVVLDATYTQAAWKCEVQQVDKRIYSRHEDKAIVDLL